MITKSICLSFIFVLLAACCFGQSNKAEDIDLLIGKEKYPEAIQLAESALKSDSLNPVLCSKAGSAYMALYHFDKALDYYSRAVHLDSCKAAYILSYGRCLSALGFKKEALREFRKAYRTDSTNKSIIATLIPALTDEDQFSEVIQLCSKLLQEDSLNSYLYSRLAYSYMQIDSLKYAAKYYEKARLLNKADITSMLQLIVLYIKLENYEKAEYLIKVGLSKYKGNGAFPKLQGDIFSKRKEYLNAIINYEKAISQGETSAYVYQKLGFCYFRYAATNDSLNYNLKQRYFIKAGNALDTACIKAPDNPLIYHYLGIVNSSTGQFTQAIEYFNAALELSTFEYAAEVYSYLGYCYKIQKDYKSAIDAFKRSLIYKPENIEVINNLASIYKGDTKDTDALLTFYKEYLNTNRDLSEKLKKDITARIEGIQKNNTAKAK